MSSQLYFNQYESPNIVIVPNMAVNDPPAKRRRMENNILVPIVDNATETKSKAIQEEPQTPSTSENKEVEKKLNLGTPTTKKSSWALNYLQSIGMTPQSTKSIWKHKIPRKSASQKSDKTTVSDTSIAKTKKCEELDKPNKVLVDTNKLNYKPTKDMKHLLQSQDTKPKIKSEVESITKKAIDRNNSKNNDAISWLNNKNKNVITVPKKTNLDYIKKNNSKQQTTNNCTNVKPFVSSYNKSLYKKSKNEINKEANKDKASKITSSQSDKTDKAKRVNIDRVTKKFDIDNVNKSLATSKIKSNNKLNTNISFKKDKSSKDSKANPSRGTTHKSLSNKHKVTSKSPINKKAHKTKTYKKIKVVINVICNKQDLLSCNTKESIDNNKTSASSNIDLDFLNDFDIDEIVKSLDSCNQEKNGLNEVLLKTDEVHKGDSNIPFGLFDNTQTDAMDLIKILKGEEDDDLIRQSIENQNDLLFGNNIHQKNQHGENYNALNNFVKQGISQMSADKTGMSIKIKEEHERLEIFTETNQSMPAIEITNIQSHKERKSNCFNNSQTELINKHDTLTFKPSDVNLFNEIPLPKDEHSNTTGRNTKNYYNSCLQLENIMKTSLNIIKDKSIKETILNGSRKLDESKENDNFPSSIKVPELKKVINDEEKEKINKQHFAAKITETDLNLGENKSREDCRCDNIQVSKKLHQIESKNNTVIIKNKDSYLKEADEDDIELRAKKEAKQENEANINNKQGEDKFEKHENDLYTTKKLVMNSNKNNFNIKNGIKEHVKSGDQEKGVRQDKESNKNYKTETIVTSQKLNEKKVSQNDLNLVETVKSDIDLQKSADTKGETGEGNNMLHVTAINDTTSDKSKHTNTQQATNGNQEKFYCVDKENSFNKKNNNESNIKEDYNNSNIKFLSEESKLKTIPFNEDSITDSKATFLTLNDQQSNIDAKVTRELEKNLSKCLGLPYSITSVIHNGKFSKIFSCKKNSGKNYALKIITNPRHGIDGNKKQMWDSLQHYTPRKKLFTVYLVNAFKCEEKWYILMEYYPKNLAQVLKDREKSFSIERIQDYARQLVTAVVFLRNNNMVHLDIKPGHILINSSNTILKLCGFDNLCYISKVTVLPNVGTASYRSPEVILGYPTGSETDVWSTGVVLFEIATNMKLFPGKYNNDILYKQICTVGYVPYDMINKSRYAQHHYIGTKFMRRLGPGGKDICLIKSFPRNRILCDSIYNTYFQSWGHQRTKTQRSSDIEKLGTLVTLLQKMLVIHPKHRLSIELVYGNQFIYDAYEYHEW